MNKLSLVLIACTLVVMQAGAERIEPTLESLSQNYKTPEWLQDAKLGVYTHWGPVTYAIQHHEQGNFGWYARFMYQDGSSAQAYHRQHYGDPKDVPYTKIIEKFTAPKFDADEWADVIAGAGAKFAGPISIHHDNFAMWDSDIHRWNAKVMGPKRDIAGELAKAYRAKGMKFLGAFHHGFTYHYYEFARKHGYQGSDPQYADLYGAVDARDKNKKFIPREFQEQWLALVREYVEKYKPEVIYYDFGLGWQDQDIQYKMYADYYNFARDNNIEVTVLQKDRDAGHRHYATMDLERGRMDKLTDYTWTTDTSAGPWFYHKNPIWEDSNTMIDMFVDIISKNGVMILNVAPDYEGTIPPEMQEMLSAFGRFTSVNGEGIYKTRPWPIYGEGTVLTSKGHFKIENSKAKREATYSAKDIRYTRSKDWKTIYAFTLDWPKGAVTFNALSVESEGSAARVDLLGCDKPLLYKVNQDKTITVTFPELAPKNRPSDFAHCLRFSGFSIKPHSTGIFYQPGTQRIPADKTAVHGGNISNKDGRIHNWSAWWGTSHWLFRVDQKNQAYDLRCRMINRDGKSELRIVVISDKGERHEFNVKPRKTGSTPEYVNLGQVKFKHDGVFHAVIGSNPNKLSKNSIEIFELQVATAFQENNQNEE